MPVIYLAGPITGLAYDESEDWRIQARKILPEWIATATPLRGKQYLREHGKLPAFGYGKKPLSTNKGIVTRDSYDVRNCDMILMNLLDAKRISVGTMIEMGWAYGYGTPIVLVMEPGNIHEHAMTFEIPGYIVPTLEEGCMVVEMFLEAYKPIGVEFAAATPPCPPLC